MERIETAQAHGTDSDCNRVALPVVPPHHGGRAVLRDTDRGWLARPALQRRHVRKQHGGDYAGVTQLTALHNHLGQCRGGSSCPTVLRSRPYAEARPSGRASELISWAASRRSQLHGLCCAPQLGCAAL